jgi:hypothetical protein
MGPFAAGVMLLVAVAVAGQGGDVLALVTSPPPLVRLALGASAVALGIVLLLRGLERIDPAADAPTLVRGVRLLFLAVGAAAAAVGWLGAIPVAIVAALIIAAVDVIETSFLLLVMATHPTERHEGA